MPEKFLKEELTEQIQEIFDTHIIHPVEMILFTNPDVWETSGYTYHLVEELSCLSTNLRLNEYNLSEYSSLAQKYNIEHSPGIVIAAQENHEILDYGVQFTRIPSGADYSSLIQVILIVSQGDSGLKMFIREKLKSL